MLSHRQSSYLIKNTITKLSSWLNNIIFVVTIFACTLYGTISLHLTNLTVINSTDPFVLFAKNVIMWNWQVIIFGCMFLLDYQSIPEIIIKSKYSLFTSCSFNSNIRMSFSMYQSTFPNKFINHSKKEILGFIKETKNEQDNVNNTTIR